MAGARRLVAASVACAVAWGAAGCANSTAAETETASASRAAASEAVAGAETEIETGAETGRQQLPGRVTRVVDGDTLEFAGADGALVKVRLAQIDAPEKAQPYGARSTAALSSLALGKRVRVEVVDVDRYGRTVGEIYLVGGPDEGELHINFEMVRQGHAWAYTRYAESALIIELEDEARKQQRGLWKLPADERLQPWEWRRSRRGKSASSATTQKADTACGAKRTCKEMVSCAEARFYLLECGLTRLDRDGDGVPCESKCSEYP